jgi:hypothetical protein
MIVVLAFDSSELLIGDNEIARKMFGMICQRVKWSEVTGIRKSFVKTPRGTVVTVRIVSDKYPHWRFRLRGPIVVSHRFERFEELIDILNQQGGHAMSSTGQQMNTQNYQRLPDIVGDDNDDTAFLATNGDICSRLHPVICVVPTDQRGLSCVRCRAYCCRFSL